MKDSSSATTRTAASSTLRMIVDSKRCSNESSIGSTRVSRNCPGCGESERADSLASVGAAGPPAPPGRDVRRQGRRPAGRRPLCRNWHCRGSAAPGSARSSGAVAADHGDQWPARCRRSEAVRPEILAGDEDLGRSENLLRPATDRLAVGLHAVTGGGRHLDTDLAADHHPQQFVSPLRTAPGQAVAASPSASASSSRAAMGAPRLISGQSRRAVGRRASALRRPDPTARWAFPGWYRYVAVTLHLRGARSADPTSVMVGKRGSVRSLSTAVPGAFADHPA